MHQGAKKLKKNDASTRFDVKDVTVYPEKNIVHVEGRLNSFIGSKQINNPVHEQPKKS
ncbi:hypothetical protein FACS1894122_11750 [Alphaproteobacteria bacterium]|nr:hypothetical protein FACS1894122_11750 [Alphaproteobacteria bacterium]